MRQQVLKALANPPRIFYVPYSLAVINFVVQFLIFVGIFVTDLIISGTNTHVDPLWLLVSVIIVHSVLAGFSKTEPQLAQIVMAKIQLIKSRIPQRLTA